MNAKQLLTTLSAGLFLAPSVLAEQGGGQEDCASRQNGEGLCESEMDFEVVRQMADIIQEFFSRCVEVREILQGVEDQAGADAAAGRVAACVAELRKQREQAVTVAEVWASNPGYKEAVLAELVARGGEEDFRNFLKSLKPVLAKLAEAEPVCYGSEELHTAVREYVGVLGIEYFGGKSGGRVVRTSRREVFVTTPLQREQAAAAMGGVIAVNKEILEVLRGVRDKATADAAAAQLQVLMEEQASLWKQAEETGYKRALEVEMTGSDAAREVNEPLMAEIRRLIDMEPRFYGSKTLKRLFPSWEDEEEE